MIHVFKTKINTDYRLEGTGQTKSQFTKKTQ